MANEPRLDQLALSLASSILLSETRSSLITRAQKDAASLLVRKPDPLLRAVVRSNGKFGIIDKTGVFIVEPIYSRIGGYFCGRAAFSLWPQKPSDMELLPGFEGDDWDKGRLLTAANEGGGDCGYFDCSGTAVIGARFQNVRQFSEDLAGAQIAGKWGFINKQGTIAIEPRFSRVREFKNGVAIVKEQDKFGSIDKAGRFVIQPDFDNLTEFCEGLACARFRDKYGYVNRSGAWAIAPQFDTARDFKNGVAKAKRDGKWCFVDLSGNIIFQCSYEHDELRGFTDGVAWVDRSIRVYASECGHEVDSCDGICDIDPCVCDHSKRLCFDCSIICGDFIDRTGKSILRDPRLTAVDRFREGLGVVKLETRSGAGSLALYGYVDNQGTVVIEPRFENAGRFKNGRAEVCPIGGYPQLIDKSGQFLQSNKTKPEYLRIGDFHDGLARIRRRKAYGFIDRSGKIVIPLEHIKPRYEWAGDFKNGFAQIAKFDGALWPKIGFIDTSGEVVILPQFEAALDFELVEH